MSFTHQMIVQLALIAWVVICLIVSSLHKIIGCLAISAENLLLMRVGIWGLKPSWNSETTGQPLLEQSVFRFKSKSFYPFGTCHTLLIARWSNLKSNLSVVELQKYPKINIRFQISSTINYNFVKSENRQLGVTSHGHCIINTLWLLSKLSPVAYHLV